MSEIKNVQLTMTESQAGTIMKALDIYSRLGIGQIDKLDTVFMFDFGRHKTNYDRDRVEELLKEVKDIIYPELKSSYYCSYGIFNPETPEESKIAWDLIQVIRHPMAWFRSPSGGGTVDFHSPHKSSLKEELASVKINVEQNG